MTNVGSLDRVIRFLLGAFLIAVPFVPQLKSLSVFAGFGPWIWAVLAVGVILVLTAIFRFCPAYKLIGLRT